VWDLLVLWGMTEKEPAVGYRGTKRETSDWRQNEISELSFCNAMSERSIIKFKGETY